jgi:hypothetical protein
MRHWVNEQTYRQTCTTDKKDRQFLSSHAKAQTTKSLYFMKRQNKMEKIYMATSIELG